MIKRIIGAAALCCAMAFGASAATVNSGEGVYAQNQKWVVESIADYVLTLQLTAPFATPCGQDVGYSGCGYQSNGHLLVVDNVDDCNGWCGTEIGSFFLDSYTKYAQIVVDANDYLGKTFVLHFNGQNAAKLVWDFALAQPPVTGPEAPAPVPLPAAGLLLGGALLGLAGAAKRRRRIAR